MQILTPHFLFQFPAFILRIAISTNKNFKFLFSIVHLNGYRCVYPFLPLKWREKKHAIKNMHLHNCCILRQIDKPQQQLVNIWYHRNDNHCWLVKNNKESVSADNISKYIKDMQNMYTETITTISSHSPPHNCQDCWLWQFCIEHICGPSLVRGFPVRGKQYQMNVDIF